MRILIVRVGAMGDVLHALPAVTALKRLRPDWAVDWVVDQRWEPLLKGSEELPGGAVRRTFPVPVRAWKQAPFSPATLGSFARFRELRGQYDAVVDMQGTLRSGLIAALAGGRGRVAGYADPRESAASTFYARKLVRRGTHVVEQGAALLGDALGLGIEVGHGASTSPGPLAGAVDIPLTAAAEDWAEREALRSRPLAVLAPSAGWGAKQWPAERFGQVAAGLRARGFDLAVNAARADDALARRVVEASGGAARVVACDVARLIALMRRTDLFLGGDSGPLHLAAALAVPLVALFGPTCPDRNGPWGPGPKRVLRDPASTTTYKRTPETDPGLGRISSEQVLAAALEL